MMDLSPSKMNAQQRLPSVAGVKRPAPTLLPAFEPFSSSPMLPRPAKRTRQSPSARETAYEKYPTPFPTSSTGIIPSSPPQVQGRPSLHRTKSSLSERGPLSILQPVYLPENGDTVRMGRSSNSSQYQLSANRLISRVHIKARYVAAEGLDPSKVEIICTGWNGAKLHCQGQTWELNKGDSFSSEAKSAQIMLDVQDARVLIGWPLRDRKSSVETEASWDECSSPPGRTSARSARGQTIESSPLRRNRHVQSPVSPTPVRAGQNILDFGAAPPSSPELPAASVQIYEDESAEQDDIAAGNSMISTIAATSFQAPFSQSSDLSEPEEDQDPDEENDPVVHSFGPFGANISSRMASFTTAASPEAARGRTKGQKVEQGEDRSSSESTLGADTVPIVNHVANQLAFSRLSSTPLSVIMNNLPANLRGTSPSYLENKGLSMNELQKLLNAAACIGEIHREGKDAAGKALESEYYYIPDEDTDVGRRAAVVDGLRKPSLRNCRKQHKQYYWKKPRTP